MDIMVYNIKVESLINVLSQFDNSGYVDITLIKGMQNDSLRISPSNFIPPINKQKNKENTEIKFNLNNINDYI